MDRNAILRWLLITGLIFGGYWIFYGRKANEHPVPIPLEVYADAPGFAPDVIDQTSGKPAPPPPPQGETCVIAGNRYEAELSTRGAGLTHLRLTDARYLEPTQPGPDKRYDLSTTPDVERWRNLRTLFRRIAGATSADDQVRYDRFNWQLARSTLRECEFRYEDPGLVRIIKTVSAGQRPFELNVLTEIVNLSDVPRTHTTRIEAFTYRLNKEVKGKLGRVSPLQTSLECARGNEVKRFTKDAGEFKKSESELKGGDLAKDGSWVSLPLIDRYAAIPNYYFAQALVPVGVTADEGGYKPACDVLDEPWYGEHQRPDDDDAGDIYKAALVYPTRKLAPGESASYRQVAFFGPKERDVLANAAGGKPRLQDLINLGNFSFVAKFLVAIITWIHARIAMGSWGVAIIVLTIGLRVTLFPLTWKQIQSAVAMRRLKPEMDALNLKFKDDAQAKNLAMMELYRKNKVNPLGGCLPALVQMPIWFALYATLQTAVEFYHTKFLWFADLSAPDKYFILPLVLGAAMIVQNRIMPQQGMDPVQQKMMTWLLPGVFTVMMLFLPAALGVYMLTNSLLGITQQLVVEKLFPRVGTPPGGSAVAGSPGRPYRGDIVVKADNAGGKGSPAPALRKGKARV